MTSSRLRELSRLASPAPWVASGEVGPLSWQSYEMTPTDEGGAVSIGDFHSGDYIVQHIQSGGRDIPLSASRVVGGEEHPTASIGNANAALVVALRNDAEKYADLRDAVEAYKKATDMRETLAAENNRSEYAVACVNETNAYNAMLAALAALGGE